MKIRRCIPAITTLLLTFMSLQTLWAQKNQAAYSVNGVRTNSASKNQLPKANLPKANSSQAKTAPVKLAVVKSTPVKNAPPATVANLPGVKQGLEFLKAGNFYQAKTAFKGAGKGATRQQRQECRTLKQMSRKYYRRYFKPLNKSLRFQKNGNYKRTLQVYRRAESRFRAIRRRSAAPLLQPVDEYLMKQHAIASKKFNDLRVASYTKALEEAKSSMKSNARFARKRLGYAKSQMNSAEITATKVEGLITDSYYNIAFQDGDRQLAKGQLEAALPYYYDAKRYRNSKEIQDKISNTRYSIYIGYFAKGDCFFNQRKYQLSVDCYNRAKTYADDLSAINEQLLNNCSTLFGYGNASFESGYYQDAIAWYNYAALFANRPSLDQARTKANNYLQHQICINRANAEVDAGNVPAAYSSLNAAVQYRVSDASNALKNKLDAYFSNIRTARIRLDEGNIAEATQAVQSARYYVPQGAEAKSMADAINSYRWYINEARAALGRNDRLTARVKVAEAQKIANTPETRSLSVEAYKQ